MKKVNVAIIGASGLVGQNIIKCLQKEKMLSIVNLKLYVSNRSAGKTINILGENYELVLLDENALNEKFDIAFFSAGDGVSKNWVEKFANNGAYVIDNTNAFRKKDYVPLVVPEININKINSATKIIANPNCSTIQLALAIKRLLDYAKKEKADIEKIVVSTYQSVSGAGQEALNDLINKTTNKFDVMINDNVLLKIGDIEENGFCTEENKIMFELCKILEKNLSVCANTVRVPIPYCHSESVYVKFNKNVNFSHINDFFYTQYIKLEKDIVYPTNVKGNEITYVSRLRKFSDSEITFFVVADNLIRGAAYNAVMIAKYILNNLLTR